MISHVLPLAVALLPIVLADPVIDPVSLFQPYSGPYPTYNFVGPDPLPIWVKAYEAAKAAGKIPSFPTSTNTDGVITYPAGVSAGAEGVCNWSSTQCRVPGDLFDAPAGVMSTSFDDGPSTSSATLYAFLKAEKIKATHFMIGSEVVGGMDKVRDAVASGGQIAGHTWSHSRMSTLTDMQLVGELGWTGQAIFDATGLVIAQYRPPYGDTDYRVSAIAREVFGLKTIMWDFDTSDWCIHFGSNTCPPGKGPGDAAGLSRTLNGFYSAPRSEGHLILMHEISPVSINAFMENAPLLKANGWESRTTAGVVGMAEPWYLNSDVNENSQGGGNITPPPSPPVPGPAPNPSSAPAPVPVPTTVNPSGSSSSLTMTTSNSARPPSPTSPAPQKEKKKENSAASNVASQFVGLITMIAAFWL